MKIVQNVLFTLCVGRFGQIAFRNVLDPKIALLDWNSRLYVRTVGFLSKLYKTCFSCNGEDVLAKSHFSTFGSQKIALPDWISRQYVKTVGFLWKLYKTCFSGHVEDVPVKSHFQRFGANNRSSGLKLTPIRENSRLSMKIVQNVLFRPRGGRFGENAFSTSRRQNRSTGLKFTPIRENSRLSIKIVQNVLFTPNGIRFGENAFSKRAFHAMRRTFWPKCICQRFRSKNRSTGLKFTPIRENSRLSMKIVQNVLFSQWGEGFGQIAFFQRPNFFNVSAKNRSTGLNFTPIRENSRLSIKIVQNVLFTYVGDVSVKTHFQNVLFTLCGGRFGQNAHLSTF